VNNIIILIIALFFLNNCSFNENSRIWKDKDKNENFSNQENVKKLFEEEEIISSVQNGIYAVNFSGGQVDITNGQFVFTASEAYEINNGKIGSPIKGMTLIGNGPQVLNKVSMVGDDLQLDDGVGTCGKDGQSVPVGVGQPTLKIDEITVGGTKV